MANLKASKKAIKKSRRNQLRNIAIKSSYKLLSKKFLKSVQAENKDESAVLFKELVRELDKINTKGVFHKKKVARKKSNFAAILNKAFGKDAVSNALKSGSTKKETKTTKSASTKKETKTTKAETKTTKTETVKKETKATKAAPKKETKTTKAASTKKETKAAKTEAAKK